MNATVLKTMNVFSRLSKDSILELKYLLIVNTLNIPMASKKKKKQSRF